MRIEKKIQNITFYYGLILANEKIQRCNKLLHIFRETKKETMTQISI